jgi:hypothetical protein
MIGKERIQHVAIELPGIDAVAIHPPADMAQRAK